MGGAPARFIAIDWSGQRAAAGQRRHIAWAEAVPGRLTRLVQGLTRQDVEESLLDELAPGTRAVVGLDCCFSVPRWWLERKGLATAPELWAWLAGIDLGAWLEQPEEPFWLRRSERPAWLHAEQELRATEREASPGAGPKPVFQLSYPGSVGKGSLWGMRMLHALRGAGFAVWPFDPPGERTLVEIYPRDHVGPGSTRDAAGRLAAVERWERQGASFGDGRTAALASTDALDAAVSALALAFAWDPGRLPAPLAGQELEGRIWRPPHPPGPGSGRSTR